MTFYQIVSLLFGTGLIGTFGGYLLARIKKNQEKTEAVARGVQALLRVKMIECYNEHIDKGYAPIYIKENFENMYDQYHTLGVNGVMDDIHEKFLNLPTEREVKRNES